MAVEAGIGEVADGAAAGCSGVLGEGCPAVGGDSSDVRGTHIECGGDLISIRRGGRHPIDGGAALHGRVDPDSSRGEVIVGSRCSHSGLGVEDWDLG